MLDRLEGDLELKIYKTLIHFSDVDTGNLFQVDTIGHLGRMWLIPEWLDSAREGIRKPTRIMCLDVLPHQKTPGGPTDFILNAGISRAVFDGEAKPKPGDVFIVIEEPDIRFPSIGG